MNEPQTCHLTLTVEEERRFTYCHEGAPWLRLAFSGPASQKQGSDADIQVNPPLHQLVFFAPRGTAVDIEFLPVDGMVLRPGRAREGEAILSQLGKPLIYGVNGLYDRHSDLYATWHGFPWQYQAPAAERRDGRDLVRLSGTCDGGCLVINLYHMYYRKHLGYGYHNPRARRHSPRTVTGWATWEAHRGDVTLEAVERSAAFLERELAPYGLRYVQVDDGYQSRMMPPPGQASLKEGWLATNDKFPGGHAALAGAIRSHGLEAAIWLNAAIQNEEYARTSGKCIRNADGEPLKGPWLGYVFDCTEESCREIEALYRALAEEGYTYFKVDAIRHLIYDGLQLAVREGLLTNDQAEERFRNYMRAVRRGIGEENYLLSCWGVLTPNIGICDAMRFATDASANEPSFYMQVGESARWHHTHGILYRNDPDYICLRMANGPARSVASLVALNGYLSMISDDVSLYTADKLDIARKTIPATDAVTAETGPLDCAAPMNYYDAMEEAHLDRAPHASGSLWATHYVLGDRTWAVINRINPSRSLDGEAQAVDLERLGLDPGRAYAVYDFWGERPLGLVKGSLSLPAPAALDCSVLALTPVAETIQFIGSNRHVSMDVVSVRSIRRDGEALTLELEGVAGRSFDYWFHTGRYTCAWEGPVTETAFDGPFFRCRVAFGEDAAATLTVTRKENW